MTAHFFSLPRIILTAALLLGPGCGGDDSGDSGGDNATSGSGTETGSTTTSGGGSDGTGGQTGTGSGSGSDGSSSGTGGVADIFSDVTFEAHPEVVTVLRVNWTQSMDTDGTWIRFTYENNEWHESPHVARSAGEHNEVVLGVPEGIGLSFQLVGDLGGTPVESEVFMTTNGDAPEGLPRANINGYDANLASSDRWMLGAVAGNTRNSYGPNQWIYIMDRQGRVVWYHDPVGGSDGDLTQAYWPRISPDGTHISIDHQIRGENGELLFTTLDFEYTREVDLPDQSDCYDVTAAGHVLYNNLSFLLEVSPDGQDIREVWEWAGCGSRNECYSNTVNWDPASDSVVMSFPYSELVLQIDRQSGNVLRRFGNGGDYTFIGDGNLGLEFNHWAHINEDGNFFVSTHMPGSENGPTSQREHLFIEFAIDDTAQTLTEVWSHRSGPDEYPDHRGMGARVASGGNVLANYGPLGVVIEVTPADQTVWRVEFEEGLMVSNNILFDDLYALNRGP